MTEQSEHLSSAQIENYGNRTSGAGPEAAQRDKLQRLDHQSSDDQRVNDQRIDDQRIDDRQIKDQQIHDRQIDDLKISDLKIDDQQLNDQRVEAHLADCASCRNRLLDFHRSLFATAANPPETDRPNADRPKNDEPTTDPPEHDTSLSGHSPSAHSSSGQRPADSRLEGASPTSALADSKSANPKYPVQAQVRTAPTPECPSDDALRQLAAGLTPEYVAATLTRHAATCNHCGPLLRTYTEIFSDDFTPEEQAALNNLQSASPAWQKKTARKMLEAEGTAAKTSAVAADASAANKKFSQQKSFKGSNTTTSGRKPFFWKWALVPASAAMVALAVFGIRYTQRDTPEKAEALLAQAYTEQRTMEIRWPGAKWGPIRRLRDAGPDQRSNRSESLLRAEGMIIQNRLNAAEGTRWLRMQAEAELFEEHPQTAIELLNSALQLKPNDPPLLMDLSIAYFQLGETSKNPREYRTSLELLARVIERQPSNTVARYNQAIALEHLHEIENAIFSWKNLLRFETDPKWADEARRHLNMLKEQPQG